VIARAINKRSNRAARAFIGVNCAAIPPSLIASELFGHEKGAFTGAAHGALGRFESANGGTIFLDEVGDLPPEVQIALLRVLQERESLFHGGEAAGVSASCRECDASLPASKAQLLKILEACWNARTADAWKPHSMFGKMTPKEWGKLMQIHVDYHLRQFAA
jgi:transcriptional regulator with AAA-type ATPase domain